MEGKLKQLDAEKEELAKYQAVDKERRSLEYAIYNNQISDTRAKLDQVGSVISMVVALSALINLCEPCDLLDGCILAAGNGESGKTYV